MDKGKSVATGETAELPSELDFFKYAQGGSSTGKRKEMIGKEDKPSKKQKVDRDAGESVEDAVQPSS